MLRSEHVAQLCDAVVCLLELRGGCGALPQLVLVRPFDHGSDVVVTPDRVGAFDVKRIAIRVHATQLVFQLRNAHGHLLRLRPRHDIGTEGAAFAEVPPRVHIARRHGARSSPFELPCLCLLPQKIVSSGRGLSDAPCQSRGCTRETKESMAESVAAEVRHAIYATHDAGGGPRVSARKR